MSRPPAAPDESLVARNRCGPEPRERIMDTTVDEIADGIYRISTWVPDIAPPEGMTFNQFLIDAEQPLLFHTGPRAMFPLVSEGGRPGPSRRRPPLDRRRAPGV